VTVAVTAQSQRHKRATAGHQLAKLRAIAADPHLYVFASAVTAATPRDYRVGGRPLAYPDWCLILFGASIRIFGSASAAARAVADPTIWNVVVTEARRVLGLDLTADVPVTGPTRDHWSYFIKRRLSADLLERLGSLHRSLGIERAQEVGLLNDADAHSPGAYRRDHVVGIDGKVFNSPLRTLDTERVNKATGEVHQIRQDPARQRYGEGGVDGLVWGTKFAIASVRSPLANHRVILGIAHFDSQTKGGEGQTFTDLALDLAARAKGIHGFTADGAWRGTHLNQIQTASGCGIITPARRRTGSRGGIVIDGQGYAAQPLPWSRRRARREAACGGHQLWAAAGTLFEQTITAEGDSNFTQLHRGQTKRDTTRRKDGTIRHQFYAHYTLPCASGEHTWWEPLLPTTEDAAARFNRCEYLRVVPTTTTRHKQLYGMRQDTESLNAQLERAFYGQRLPAWGVHNQTAIVLFAALTENAWARQTWLNEAALRGDPPHMAA
jgi:hypothetical protein